MADTPKCVLPHWHCLSLQADDNSARVCAFIKRILQAAIHLQPAFAAGALFLVSQVIAHRPTQLSGLVTTVRVS